MLKAVPAQPGVMLIQQTRPNGDGVCILLPPFTKQAILHIVFYVIIFRNFKVDTAGAALHRAFATKA